MGKKRTFTAQVAGTSYEIPCTMGVLSDAEEISGTSLMDAFAENRYGRFIQGVICAGLKRQGVTEIDGASLSCDAVGDAIDFVDAQPIYIGFMSAMSSDVAEEESPKNAPEEGAKNSPGKPSSGTPTDPSS